LRVLVTGGAGFIGAALVERLLAGGAEVTVIDDLSSGSADRVDPRAELVRHDVASDTTAKLISSLRPTHVVHAAAQVRVDRSMLDPALDRRVNLDGTRRVLDGARAAGVHRIVFVSSGGAVYGDASAADEATLPAPRSFYGVHKLAAEGYVTISGLPYAIARPANVFGPGQRADLEGGVVAIFCAAIAAGAPIVIHGDGQQQRDFVHVDDVAAAIERMLESDADGVWNVGTGIPTSINELVALVEAIAGRAAEHSVAPPRRGDIRRSWLAVDAAHRDLGWTPTVSLADGLRRLLTSHQSLSGMS